MPYVLSLQPRYHHGVPLAVFPETGRPERGRARGHVPGARGRARIRDLAANYAIASLDRTIHAQMIEQWARFSAWSAVFAGPKVEEIVYRLVIMGGTAWVLWRFTHDRRLVFTIALAVSSILFGIAHILPGSRPTTGAVHALGVAVKSSAGGVALVQTRENALTSITVQRHQQLAVDLGGERRQESSLQFIDPGLTKPSGRFTISE